MVMCHSPSHLIDGWSSVNGMDGVVNFQRRAVAAELPRVELRQRLVHFQNRIDRAFHHAGHVADDVGHGHEILVIDALVDDGRARPSPVRATAPASGAATGSAALASPERTRSASNSSGVVRLASGSCKTMFTSSFSRGTCSKSTDSPPTAICSVCGNRLRADAVERGLFLVDHEAHLRLVGFDIPVRVHDARACCGKYQ